MTIKGEAMLKFLTLQISFLFILINIGTSSAYAEMAKNDQTQGWEIVKMSGEAWVKTQKPQKIALTKDHNFQNGDQLETGSNGRILLKRNNETIMVMPNSIISLPSKSPGEGKTQILQQIGEILLDVEKRNVKHFEISTPYLSAVVKGTNFKVSVDNKGAKVDVVRGKVEVANYETGRFVLVKPGQSAAVKSINNGKPNKLQITGTGPKEKIQQGPKRTPTLKPLKNKAPEGKVKNKNAQKSVEKNAQKNINTTTNKRQANPTKKKLNGGKKKATKSIIQKKRGNKGGFRITKAIGVTSLNLQKTTKGLARHKTKNGKPPKSKALKKNRLSKHIATNQALQSNANSARKAKPSRSEIGKGIGFGLGLGNGNGNGNAFGFGNGNGNAFGFGNGNGNAFGLNKSDKKTLKALAKLLKKQNKKK